jgi:signal transduction histidine kinase/CheY-like chemotaxis protein
VGREADMKIPAGSSKGWSLLLIPLLLIVIIACLSIGSFLIISQHYINALFNRVEKQYRQGLINITSVAHNSIEPILMQVRSGKINRGEAISRIQQIIRSMTYEDHDGRNYIFMSSYDGTMLVQPFERHKEMTNQWDLQDANGLFIIRELVKAAKTCPEGSFVSYYYYLPKVHNVQEKMAYVAGLPEIECYIGTGMYMERTLQEHREILTKIRYASVWLLIAVLIPISVSIFFILIRNRRLLAEIDIRKKAEDDRLKLEIQLSHSQKMDAIGQLAGGVAHDFNNILAGIQGNASLLMLEFSPDHPHYKRLNRIEEQVKQGANLTKQLLGFAREGKYELRILSINDIIRKSARFFIETRKEIEASFQLQEDIYPVEADTGQMEQVLLNIFINAGHAMPGGGHLHIQTSGVVLQGKEAKGFEIKPGNYVKISITDTGTGMDEKPLRRIFEPFFTTKSEEGGSGLGLASAYGIIRNHGGAINAYSEHGRGSTFNIYLPASEKNIAYEKYKPHEENLYTGTGSILLVDDEPSIVDITGQLLVKLGYTVYRAENAQEAISIYREKKDSIDLVILDMILRGISGTQVLKTLKEINPDIRVILSSGYDLQGEVQKVMEMGCLAFIQKPYNFSDLSNIIDKALKAPDRTNTD